jgi:hypothetical protein
VIHPAPHRPECWIQQAYRVVHSYSVTESVTFVGEWNPYDAIVTASSSEPVNRLHSMLSAKEFPPCVAAGIDHAPPRRRGPAPEVSPFGALR